MSRYSVLFAALALTGCALFTQAQVIPVTAPFDIPAPGDAACTLREAITNANMDADLSGGDCPPGIPGLDVILLPPGPIILDLTGPPEDLNASGDLDLLGPVHIEGAGPGVSFVDISALGERGFQVHPPTGADPTVFLAFSIVGGALTDPTEEGAAVKIEAGNLVTMGAMEFSFNAAITHGGALSIETATLVDLSGSILANNQTLDPTANGGAIINRGILLTNGNIFDQNMTAGNGGAIYNDLGGQLILANDSFLGNGAQVDGGAIANFGQYTHTGGSVESGSAGSLGGGIYSFLELDLDDLTVSGNFAGVGGGLAFAGPTGTIDNVTVTNNDATIQGGGIFNDSPSLTIYGSTITLNETTDAASEGGGIFNGPGGAITLTNSTLDDNTSKVRGGGASSLGNLSLDGTSVAGNGVTGSGGGIFSSGDLTVTGLTISGNTAANGAGLHYTGSNGQLTNMNIDGNTATTDGGGIWNEGTLTVTDTEILNNEGTGGLGGGFSHLSSSLTITNSTVAGNKALYGAGGWALGNLTLSNSTVSGNTATGSAGGLGLDPLNSTILDSTTITNNSPLGVEALGTTNFKHNIISGNAPADCSFAGPAPAPASFGYNLDGDASCFGLLGNINDLIGGIANLGPLQDNGGPTRTHMPQLPSMAVDTGDPLGLDILGNPISSDQRGEVRPTDGDGDLSAFVDRGAVERPTFVFNPAPVPDGDFAGTAMTATRNNAGGTEIAVTWDAATCTWPDTKIIYGDLANVASYTIDGGNCDMGISGSSIWTSVPAGDLFFMVVSDNDFTTEGTWGYDSDSNDRDPTNDSGTCSATTRDNTGVCGGP